MGFIRSVLAGPEKAGFFSPIRLPAAIDKTVNWGREMVPCLNRVLR
jgi:hypothetical protein